MNQFVFKKLKIWREAKATSENCELFRVFQNKTIEDISTLLPKNKDELLAIKGIREKKFQKYGNDVLAIVNECLGTEPVKSINLDEDKTYTVSDYLNTINLKLSEVGTCKIKGEVSSVNFKNHLYFSLKDKDDGSVLSCFMWANDYDVCGVEIKEGMELTIHGFPEIYKLSGRLNFRTKAIELVGEGALKKAYDELKKKLESEGLFEEARKKPIPDYPQRIGLITSRDGAVINDFMSNIGRFGYKITFVDSRVEGIMAVKDLISAVQYFKDKSVDVLVIIRGGGSLESLQAFNNEALIREIINLSMPVLCGIGHDKDVPLLSYVADKAVSTPSIVAKEINKSWERAIDRLDYYETAIISKYGEILKDCKYKLEKASFQIKDFFENIFNKFEQYQQDIKNIVVNVSHIIRHEKYRIQKIEESLVDDYNRILSRTEEKLEKFPKIITDYFSKFILETNRTINTFEKYLNQNNPERQLKLGYSIVTLNGKVVKSANQIKKGDILISKLGEGKVQSEAQEIFNN
jgi:exodeoxyribonuclease VII large subunit